MKNIFELKEELGIIEEMNPFDEDEIIGETVYSE